jgi:hypothetical protein
MPFFENTALMKAGFTMMGLVCMERVTRARPVARWSTMFDEYFSFPPTTKGQIAWNDRTILEYYYLTEKWTHSALKHRT